MCRSLAEGGRRCPCGRGDRRRAAARLRYAARIAAARAQPPAASPPTEHAAASATGDLLSALQERRDQTRAAADTALAALRAGGGPDAEAAYAQAVLAHGQVLRDIAEHRIDTELARRGLDDNAIAGEALDIQQRLQRADDELTDARTALAAAINNGAKTESDAASDAAAATAQAVLAYKRVRREAQQRANDIDEQRAAISKATYYETLSAERTFGNADFVPANTAKMTRADRAMFTATTALYPDEMVQRSAGLGSMLAKRSKARAHYNAGARQTTRRKTYEVLSLEHAMTDSRLSFANAYYVGSPDDVAAGRVDHIWRKSMIVARTPENEARIGQLVQEYNARSPKPAVMRFATAPTADGGTEEVIYVQGHRTRIRTESAGLSAEITYSDSRSMVHELAHRMEDRKSASRQNTSSTAAQRACRRRGTSQKGTRHRRQLRVGLHRQGLPQNRSHRDLFDRHGSHHPRQVRWPSRPAINQPGRTRQSHRAPIRPRTPSARAGALGGRQQKPPRKLTGVAARHPATAT